MKLDIYVEKYGQEGVFENIDLFDDESFMMEFKLKDNADLSKVFSTYSKEVVIPASPKNNQILHHYFDQSILRSGNRFIKAKIYLNEELFKVGVISITEGKYKDNRLITYKIHFNTGLTSLKDKLGNDELRELDFSYLNLDWTPNGIRDAIQSTATNPPVIVPLISRNKVWAMNGDTEQNISTGGKGYIRVEDVRPAIRLSTVFDKIFQKYDLNIDIPWKNERMWQDMYLWCNNKMEEEFNKTKINLTQPSTTNSQQDPSQYFSGHVSGGNYIINYTGNHTDQNRPYEFYMNLGGVRNPFSNKVYEDEFTISIEDDYGNIYQQVIDGNKESGGTYYISIPIPVQTGNISREYTVYINSNNSIKYDSISIYFRLRNPTGGFFGVSSVNNTASTINNKFNFSYGVGNIKLIDLFTSLIKMYNISIIEDKLTDKLIFLRSKDIVRKTIDFTSYTDVSTFNKTSNKIFKEIIFTHKESDFMRNEIFRKTTGKEYGSATYVSNNSLLSGEYEIETDFEVMSWFKIYGGNVIMSYGFDSPDSPVDNSDSIVIFYNQGSENVRNLNGDILPLWLGLDDDDTPNGIRETSFNRYIRVGNQTISGDSLTFDIDISPSNNAQYPKSLYAEYYSDVISRMYDPNTRLSKYDIYLPPHILNDFNMTDYIIIGGEKFTIEEASIDVSSGKGKLTLMNIVADNTAFDAIPITPTLLVVIGESKTSLRVNYNGSDAKYGVKGHWIEYRVLGNPTWLSWGFNPVLYNNNVSYSILIEDLQPDTMYDVRVRTEDNIGNFSGWKIGQGKTLDHNAYVLEAPTNLYLNSTEYDKIEVGYNNFGGQQPTEELEGYEIQWKRGVDVNWASMFIPRTWSDQQSYIIILDNLLGDTLYDVRIRSKDTFGRYSEWKMDSITTPAGGTTPTLPTPVLFTVGSPYNSTIKFKWTGASVANSQGVNGYEIKANLDPSGTPEYSQTIPLGSSPQYDINLNVNLAGVYKCKVRAVGDNNTFSNWSADLLQSVNSN